MKTGHYYYPFVLLLTAVALISSCTDATPYLEDEAENSYIYTDQSSISIKNGESKEVYVNSNGYWHVTDSPYWLNISSGSQYWSGYFSFTADNYGGSSSRYGTITVSNIFGKQDHVYVTQEPSYLSVSPERISVSGSETSGSFDVYSSDAWYISNKSYWINVSSSYSSGNGDDWVYFTVDRNTTSSSRTGYITLKSRSNDNLTAEVTVTQARLTSTTENISSWTSTNHRDSSSDYARKYLYNIKAGDELSFFYDISSESGCDKFYAYIENSSGTRIATLVSGDSGEKSWQFASYTFSGSGTYRLYLSYEKDYSISIGSDKVYVYNITLTHYN